MPVEDGELEYIKLKLVFCYKHNRNNCFRHTDGSKDDTKVKPPPPKKKKTHIEKLDSLITETMHTERLLHVVFELN